MSKSAGMIGLSDSLLHLRSELTRVARVDPKSELAFQIEDVALEMNVVATDKESSGGGIKWFIFSLDASAEFSTAVTHKLTMRFKVVERGTGELAKVSSVDTQLD